MIRSKALIFNTFWGIKRPNNFDVNQKRSSKITAKKRNTDNIPKGVKQMQTKRLMWPSGQNQ